MILLKILPKYFKDVESGIKNFEIRKNDRKYEVGKYVCLREFDGKKFTGKFVIKQIQYIYEGSGLYGLSEGYCILGLASILPEPQIYKAKAEQEPIFDKIRAEIEQSAFDDVNGSKYIFVNVVNQIIDKHKAESEG